MSTLWVELSNLLRGVFNRNKFIIMATAFICMIVCFSPAYQKHLPKFMVFVELKNLIMTKYHLSTFLIFFFFLFKYFNLKRFIRTLQGILRHTVFYFVQVFKSILFCFFLLDFFVYSWSFSIVFLIFFIYDDSKSF